MVKRAKTMAINKELYERYKAMKATKSASESEQQPPKTGFAALNNSPPEQPAQENPPLKIQIYGAQHIHKTHSQFK